MNILETTIISQNGKFLIAFADSSLKIAVPPDRLQRGERRIPL